jgi:cyclomaltodextrinase
VTAPEPNYAAWNGRADAPSWNLGDTDTRNYLLNIVRRWIELGVDGWGVASPEAGPHEFWAMFREAAKAMEARTYVVGRVSGEALPWGMGDQFDAVTDARFRKATFDFLADGTLDARSFNDILGRIRVGRPDPLNRIAFNSLDGDRRLATLPDAERRLMVLFQMTFAGAPVIRSGDEIGLGGATSAGRASYAWNGAARDDRLLEFYRQLLHLRRDHSALRRGSFTPVYAEGNIYAYVRRSSEELLLVILNRSDSEATFKLPLPKGGAAVKQKDAIDLLTGSRHGIRSSEIFVREVPALSGVILQLR